ncbi:DUF4132 domain-containing protein [Stieleria mannarensis]|uniref:DUF4132 domain-containing protein n=1 Tax=Stieleria mannarensis TaxID=2755585 RepID=UPI00256FCC08|nr:DUF4132 domain-containing protein [Rhodopirellula sp. JC639]
MPAAQAIAGSDQLRPLRDAVAAFEGGMGRPWDEALDVLTDRGIHLALIFLPTFFPRVPFPTAVRYCGTISTWRLGAVLQGGLKQAGKSMTSTVQQQDAWVDTERDYKLGLRAGKLVCQNPKGKSLASVPKWLKETETAESLMALADWLAEHELECLHAVERWMLRSLSIPRTVLNEIWADPAWRAGVENMVIVPVAAGGKFDLERAGLLRQVDAKRGLGVIDLDGETRWFKSDAFAVPHPILIGDLEELCELAGDLGIRQSIDQLYRPIYQPTEDQSEHNSINDFSGGHFEQLNFALSHCRRLGYPVRGGYATCRVWENHALIEARYFVGDEYPESPTWTGGLVFVDENQKPQRINSIGPVTFSEGVRMASEIYAKRKVDSSEEDA